MSAAPFILAFGPIALGVVALGGIGVVAALIQRRADTPRCIACDERLREGHEVFSDAGGGVIHAACCGPERESYLGVDGEPLRDDEPIPTPWRWSRDYA